MSNSFFCFKQFTIHHDRCAMKVGTDAVLLGAWAETKDAGSILDVGSGSGIIAVMMAQRTQATIHAIEIDVDAASQAAENVQQCPWKERITIIQAALQDFALRAEQKYDLIVSNPPYFQNSLKAPGEKRNMARHDDGLSFSDLMSCSEKVLTEKGTIALIIPYEGYEEMNAAALRQGLFCTRKTIVKTKAGTEPKRILLEFSRIPAPVVVTELCIHNADMNYSEEYKNLTNGFYLRSNR